MRRKEALPELLAPAGSFECLVAAIAAGADAIYVGGRRFGARAFAKNFDLEELVSAVKYSRLHGRRLYVTVNTLAEDRELSDIVDYARELWKIGVDALIISDLGALAAIREALPEMELHASTQMSVHSTLGADAAYSLGCRRVVLARELSLENIRSAVENSKTEIEVFLHGALCVCHSGQCLFSSLVGGRSGNRGECAQPCRLPYSTPRGGEYPLSLKDLSLAEHIPALISSGVASLKIEGRMKSPGYVYTVTKIYRRLLDEGRAATAEELSALRQAFSRGGFTDGYLKSRLDEGMLGIRSEGDKEESRKIDSLVFSPERVSVRSEVKILRGAPAEMTLTDGKRSATVKGDIPATAETAPLTDASIKERLSKMGNTYLSLAKEDIELTLDAGLNLSPKSLNALRREAAEQFCDFSRQAPENKENTNISDEKNLHLSFDIFKANQLKNADNSSLTTAEFYSAEEYLLAKSAAPELFNELDRTFVPLYSSPEAIAEAGGIILPAVILDSELPSARSALATAKSAGAKCAVAQNIGQISLLSELGFEVFGGFRLNTSNAIAKEQYRALGAEKIILSPELTLPKARDTSGGVITYGKIPLMLTERCFTKENFGCEGCGNSAFVDRRGESFPVIREHSHRNIILNSQITYMGDKSEELSRARLNHRHLLFTNESAAEIISALTAHKHGAPLPASALGDGRPPRRMGRRDTADKPNPESGTKKAKAAKNQAPADNAKAANTPDKAGYTSKQSLVGSAKAESAPGKASRTSKQDFAINSKRGQNQNPRSKSETNGRVKVTGTAISGKPRKAPKYKPNGTAAPHQNGSVRQSNKSAATQKPRRGKR